VVRLHLHSVDRLADRHSSRLGQRLRQEAGVRRIEMLDEHEGHTALDRETLEELREGLEPSRRGAYPDDRELVGSIGGVRRSCPGDVVNRRCSGEIYRSVAVWSHRSLPPPPAFASNSARSSQWLRDSVDSESGMDPLPDRVQEYLSEPG